MRTEDYEFLYQLEEKYWWFVGMREITDTVTSKELQKRDLRILDAGCGTGYNLGHYASTDRREVYGFDIAKTALDWVKKRGFRKIAQASVTEIPFKSETFDVVFSFDVLQQLPSDINEAGFREMHRILRPGGLLFIRVAAFEWLRSSHDEEVQTMHRFTRAELGRKIRQSGFSVEWISYANTLLFPVVLVRRLLKRVGIGGGTDVKPLPRGLGWVDGIFRRMLLREAKWFRAGRTFPFGLSIICCARKVAE
jgi:SAM-dependent methyltransferase